MNLFSSNLITTWVHSGTRKNLDFPKVKSYDRISNITEFVNPIYFIILRDKNQRKHPAGLKSSIYLGSLWLMAF